MICPMCNKEHPYTIPQALAKLAASSRRLEKLTSGMSPKKAAAGPAPGKWSAKEIICHLADCELVYGLRFRQMITRPGASLTSFDQDVWARTLKYRDQNMKSALAAFSALRGGNVALLKSLSKNAWKKTGRHPAYGELTLRQFVSHLVDHDRNHIAQIQKQTVKPPRKKA